MAGPFRKPRNLSGRSIQSLANLYQTISSHSTLLEVMNWARLHMSLNDVDIITQDEFTIDAVFPLEDGLYLVYGLT